MEHLEFIDKTHFQYEYHRTYCGGELSNYIDFCWETDFENLLDIYPNGFSDVLFPNIGYTYLVNIGTPFTMQLQKASFEVKSEGFLPRHHYITCHHSKGNRLFGIKFKVCPIVFEKDIDFSEYKENIYPLAYLIEKDVVSRLKKASSFDERVTIVFDHYGSLIEKYRGKLKYVNVVTEIIKESLETKRFDRSIQETSAQYNISNRTLQRYFNATTSFSSKQALQTLRIRNAVIDLTSEDKKFSYEDYGYYDYSHFLKHLQQFVGTKYFKKFQSYYQ